MLVAKTDTTTARRARWLAGTCLGIALWVAPATGEESLDPFAGLAPAGDQLLSESQGGASEEVGLAELGASVVGNSITGTITTGSATIGGEAFSDLNGVSSVLLNSGNNVSIQSSTVVNITIYE